jgi:glycosyltransferase involved in cell wall biosynthesis
MQIVQLVQRYPPARGGSESYFARLSRWLARRGHGVHVATTTARDLTAFWDRQATQVAAGITIEEGVTVERHPLGHVPLQRWLLRGLSLVPIPSWQGWVMSCNPLSWSLRRWAQTYDGPCDIIHATAFPYAWPLRCALLLARRRRVPFVLTPFLHLGDLDNPLNPVRRSFTRPALLDIARQADALLVQTPQEAQAFRDLGFPSDRISEQGLGVDLAECTGGNRTDWRTRQGIAPDAVVVGHLANLSAEKGSNDLVQAVAGLPVETVLAGPVMPNFRPTSGVRILGELSESAKRDFFAGIDLFVLPSRVDSFGLVLLEAMANGVPCIGYNAGGIPGVIESGTEGLVVPCRVSALREAILRLSQNPGERRQMGEAGRSRAHSATWDDKLQLVEDLLQAQVRLKSRR